MSISDRSSTFQTNLVTSVLYNSTGTLQFQRPETTYIKNELRRFLKLPDDEESIILVSGDAKQQENDGHEKHQEELYLLKAEVKSPWVPLKDSKRFTGEIEELQIEDNKL